MHNNPLEIPEILTLVGLFLPLWEATRPHEPEARVFLFRPKTLAICLCVSKLWYKSLLPILWSRVDDVGVYLLTCRHPDERINRHSHLIRHLLVPYRHHPNYRCSNLVELAVCLRSHPLEESQADGAVKCLLPRKRLLRSNPGLRILDWTGISLDSILDVEDWVGFQCLESLTLANWQSVDGSLERILRIVAGSLKRLSLRAIDGLGAGVFTTPPPPPPSSVLQRHQQQPDDQSERHAGSDHGESGLVLYRLQILEVYHDQLFMDSYLCELVKRCPNLKSLSCYLDYFQAEVISSRLANSLRIYCPNLETFSLLSPMRIQDLDTLLRHCSTSGLCEIQVPVGSSVQGLVSALLQHSATLEDLRIYIGDDIQDLEADYLRLLVECTRLKRFSHVGPDLQANMAILEALAGQTWGCRGLQRLDLTIGMTTVDWDLSETISQENSSSITPSFGWERVCGLRSTEDLRVDETKLRRAMEVVQAQKLEKLEVVVLSGVYYQPLSNHCSQESDSWSISK